MNSDRKRHDKAEDDESSPHWSSRAIDRHSYAHDASHYLLVPEHVVVARNSDDIAKIFKKCSQQGMNLTFRSGGTSLSGQGVTDALLVDVRRNFGSIEILDKGSRVRVGPGATLRQVNSVLSNYGRVLGPDPASEVACTIGGVVANNSSGMSCGTHLNMYSTIDSLKVLLPDGTLLDTGHERSDEILQERASTLFDGLLRIRSRVRSNPESRREIQRQFSIKNTMGYSLNAFLDFDHPSEILTRLLVGSEGTLGFVAEATVRTIPLKTHCATGLIVYRDLLEANQSLSALTKTTASAIELMDAASLKVGQSLANAPNSLKSLDIKNQAAYLIEFRAESEDELSELVFEASMMLGSQVLPDWTLSRDAKEREALWQVRKGLYAAIAGSRPAGMASLLEDVSVPVERITATCNLLTDLFSRHGYTDTIIFGHAKDGNLHFMLTDRFEGKRLDQFEQFTEDLVDLILNQGGALKGEHGTGRVMAPFVERQFGRELFEVICEIKNLFDPQGILNPGVIITSDSKQHLRNIKMIDPVDATLDRCVDCGYCEPVCPSKSLTLTPRQRIAVIRELAFAKRRGDSELAENLEKDFEYAVTQTCAVDGMCQTTCPVQINTGDLVRKLRTERRSRRAAFAWRVASMDWRLTTSLASWVLTLSHLIPTATVRITNKALRKILGPDMVPILSRDLPRGGVRRSKSLVSSDSPQAVYFPSCINAIFASESRGVQKSLIELCNAAGISISIPRRIDHLCCGTPWSSKGLSGSGSKLTARVRREMHKATRGGEIPIVCDASSCTEGLIALLTEVHGKSNFTIIDSIEFVATKVMPKLTMSPKSPRIVLHPTCSSTRLSINEHLDRIARAVAEEVITPKSWGCCGFAGDRGMLLPELTASATMSEALEIGEIPASLHASCNRTCEIGISRSTGYRFEHIAESLANQVLGR